MIIATFENDGNMLRTELPKHIADLIDDLGSIGIVKMPSEIMPRRDNQYNIKLYSESVLGQALIERIGKNDTLEQLNKVCFQIDNGFDDRFKADIINESDAKNCKEVSRLFGYQNPTETDKFTINAALDFHRKNWTPSRCIVEKTVLIPLEEFIYLRAAPTMHNKTIEQNIDKMFYDRKTDTEHCLLMIDKSSGDGLLVQSEGCPYASQAQYIPNARILYDNYRQRQSKEVKFYCPLKVVYDIDYEDNEIYPEDAVKYATEIKAALAADEMPEEREHGLMTWYNYQGDEISDKVYSAHMDVEVYNDELVGVIRAKILGELTESEMMYFKNFLSGQLSDGVGESFEQGPIATSDGNILVSFWNSYDNWALIPEDEFNGEFPEPDEDEDITM